MNKTERKQIEAKGFTQFTEKPDETGTAWIRRNKDGGCFFLGKDNRCTIYEVRPAICRLEPFTIADFQFDGSWIELELNFPSACGCEGVCEGGALPAAEIAKAAKEIVRKILALTAKDMGLPLTDQRVASETRSRILRGRVLLADLQI